MKFESRFMAIVDVHNLALLAGLDLLIYLHTFTHVLAHAHIRLTPAYISSHTITHSLIVTLTHTYTHNHHIDIQTYTYAQHTH